MADEISQVVEMEYKGVYYLFKGTKAMIAAMARMVKALQEWHNEKYLKKPGNCTWEKLQEVSEGTPAVTVSLSHLSLPYFSLTCSSKFSLSFT